MYPLSDVRQNQNTYFNITVSMHPLLSSATRHDRHQERFRRMTDGEIHILLCHAGGNSIVMHVAMVTPLQVTDTGVADTGKMEMQLTGDGRDVG